MATSHALRRIRPYFASPSRAAAKTAHAVTPRTVATVSRNLHWRGEAYLAGTLSVEFELADGDPPRKRYAVLDDSTNLLVAQGWSDGAGAFRVDGLRAWTATNQQTYTVIEIDPAGARNSVLYSHIKAWTGA